MSIISNPLKWYAFFEITCNLNIFASDQYINFCDSHNLEYEIIDKFEWVNNEKIDLTVKVKESLLDYQEVYHIIKSRIEKSRLETKFKTEFNREIIESFGGYIEIYVKIR